MPCKKSRLDARERKLWRDGIYDEIREVMPVQGNASIERMCQLALVSRAGFYRFLKDETPVEEDMELRSAIPANRAGTSAPLWLPSSFGGAAAERNAGQSQARGAHHARRQPAGRAATALTQVVRDHPSEPDLLRKMHLSQFYEVLIRAG